MDNNIYLSGLIPPHMVIYLIYHHDEVLYPMMLDRLKSQFRRMVVPFFDEYGEVIL